MRASFETLPHGGVTWRVKKKKEKKSVSIPLYLSILDHGNSDLMDMG